MGRIAARRQKLFEVNSAGLVAIGLGEPDTFVCPLCMKKFTKDDLKPRDTPNGPEVKLTLAHVIPEALGGTLCTLACKDCNNGVGMSLEAALKEQFVVEDAVNGTGMLHARLVGDFGNIGVEVGFPSGGQPWQLEPVAKISNPSHMAALDEMLEGTEVDLQAGPRCELKLEYKRQPGVVGTALYHAAYLMMFHYCGYPFASSPLGEKLREQFRQPDKDILPRDFSVPPEDWAAANVDPACKHALVLVREPYIGILVMMRFQPDKGLPRVIGVALADLDGKVWPTGPVGLVRGSIVRIKTDGTGLPPWVPRPRLG
jgi:hypothetical protein